MKNAATACLVALLAIVPGPSEGRAGAAEPACIAARDKALSVLDEAALAIETAIDSDVAIAGSSEYELMQTKDEQIGKIEQERREVLERYRRCAGNQPLVPAR